MFDYNVHLTNCFPRAPLECDQHQSNVLTTEYKESYPKGDVKTRDQHVFQFPNQFFVSEIRLNRSIALGSTSVSISSSKISNSYFLCELQSLCWIMLPQSKRSVSVCQDVLSGNNEKCAFLSHNSSMIIMFIQQIFSQSLFNVL